ncbi:hypothetical protein [Thalassotalea maritima]|uniref:hypothetical protein n=1 Tax=Thalassotalea maritima TaxID=3242416 RepID=UPI00352944CB
MANDIKKIETQTKSQEQNKELQSDSKTDGYGYIDKPNAIVGLIDLVKSLFK